MKPHLVLASFTLLGCGAQTRDIGWFERHPVDAAEVAENCGARTSPTCVNARAALDRLQARSRRQHYRQGFR